MVVLGDRRIPDSKVRIESIAVSPAGVFVVGTKNHKGLVRTKCLGPFWDLGPLELYVGHKNRTDSVEHLVGQVDAVRMALQPTPWGSEVPVHALLCLPRAEWGIASAITISDVWVGWPELMARRVQTPVVMDSSTVHEVAQLIVDNLPIA